MFTLFKKFTKKLINKWTIAMSICLVSILSLFAMNCTYAFTIDNEGNLVGDNLFGDLNYVNGFSMNNLSNGVTYTISVDNSEPHTFKCSDLPGSSLSIFEYTGLSYTFTKTLDMNNYYLYVIERSNFTAISDYVMLNEGSTALAWEPYGVWYSSTNYNDIVNNYNSLLASYNDLEDRFNEVIGESSSAMYFALNGATANLYTDVSGVKTLLASDTISINENYMNFDNSCIPNINTYLNGYDSEDSTTYPNPYCYIEIDLNMSVNSVLLFTFDNTILDVDITLSSTISNVTNIYKRNSSLNAYQLVVNNDRLSFNKISYDGIYMPDYISIDFSLQIDGYSYSVGYDKGVASQQSRINSLNSSISSMQNSINTLRASNQQLQDAINNSFGWKNLFFAMADTPFKTVSNVLGFELFGLNLFTTFIGMITVFAIIWLLKKFI